MLQQIQIIDIHTLSNKQANETTTNLDNRRSITNDSCKYTLNNSGDNDPCLTPLVTLKVSDEEQCHLMWKS